MRWALSDGHGGASIAEQIVQTEICGYNMSNAAGNGMDLKMSLSALVEVKLEAALRHGGRYRCVATAENAVGLRTTLASHDVIADLSRFCVAPVSAEVATSSAVGGRLAHSTYGNAVRSAQLVDDFGAPISSLHNASALRLTFQADFVTPPSASALQLLKPKSAPEFVNSTAPDASAEDAAADAAYRASTASASTTAAGNQTLNATAIDDFQGGYDPDALLSQLMPLELFEFQLLRAPRGGNTSEGGSSVSDSASTNLTDTDRHTAQLESETRLLAAASTSACCAVDGLPTGATGGSRHVAAAKWLGHDQCCFGQSGDAWRSLCLWQSANQRLCQLELSWAV